jgi:uncharacterized phage protein (TIGR02218 family)
MSDDYLTAEASIEDSAPREFYEIVQSAAVTYRIASGVRDIVYNGQTFTAYPSARTEVSINTISKESQLTLALPLSHPLAQRYVAAGSPPRQVLLTMYRQQGTLVERYAGGVITSMAMERHLAKFLVQSQIARLAQRTLPLVSASRYCQHVLYDANCRVSRVAYTINATVTFNDGRRVQVSTMASTPDQWAQLGELVHIRTGERMTIVDHSGLFLTMQAPIPDLTDGDAVAVSAGCAHDIVTCRQKFANQVNFGGFPQLPTKNPFTPTGLGVVEQS